MPWSMKTIILILMASSLTSAQNSGTEQSPLVVFGDVEILPIDDTIITGEYIDEERGNPGNFIYANNHALRFLDANGHHRSFVGLPGETAPFHGTGTNAAFATINHFSQFSDDEILVPDLRNHCIRHIQKSTKNVTAFMGNCGVKIDNNRHLPSKEQPIVAKSQVTMSEPTRVSYRDDQNVFYILESKRLLKFDPTTDQVSLFFDVFEQNATLPSDLLWSADGLFLYISHSRGLSKLNMETKQWTAVARPGTTTTDGNTLLQAKISNGLGAMDWVIPDRILVLADTAGNQITVLNLLEDSVSYLCARTAENTVNERLILGAKETCKVTKPQAMRIINGTLYSSSFVGLPTDSTENSQFIRVSFEIPECTVPETNGSISFIPSKTRYLYADQIKVTCPQGQSLQDLYSTLTCIRVRNTTSDKFQGDWDNPVPQCGDPELRHMFPVEGQRAGGTLLTANGSFPTTMYIQVKHGDQATNVPYTGSHYQVMFRMPAAQQTTTSPVEIIFHTGHLSDDRILGSKMYEYRPNPIISTSSAPIKVIQSGGQTIKFSGQNILLSARFQLQILQPGMKTISLNCTVAQTSRLNGVQVEVHCILPSLDELKQEVATTTAPTFDRMNNETMSVATSLTNTTSETADTSSSLRRRRNTYTGENILKVVGGHLTSDGVMVEGSDKLQFQYQLDPVIHRHDIGQVDVPLTDDATINFPGERLNVSVTKSDYSIRFPDSANLTCTVVKLTYDSLVCSPSKDLVIPEGITSITPRIIVHVGSNLSFQFDDGWLTFTRPSPATPDATTGIETNWWIILVVFFAVALVIVIIIGVIWYRQRLRRRRSRRSLPAPHITSFTGGLAPGENGGLAVKLNPEILNLLKDMYINDHDLSWNPTSTPIGRGHFGNVLLGQLNVNTDDQHFLKTVAVKTLKNTQDIDAQAVEEFLQEAVFLSGMKRHINILKALGVVWRAGDRPIVVFPFMANGDLCSLIRRADMKFTTGDMLHFALQIACGMEYFSNHKLVHRDLACRNCLVGEDFMVKIADFGMSRDAYEDGYYRESSGDKPKPVKWMSLESLREYKYTSKSDVWSFGVLMWELQTRGGFPYPGVDNSEVLDYLHKGRRLEKPSHTHPNVYDLMYRCWYEDPHSRPTFKDLHEFLRNCLGNHPNFADKSKPQAGEEHFYSYAQDYTKHIPSDYYADSKFIDQLDDSCNENAGTPLQKIYEAYGLPFTRNEDAVDYRTQEPHPTAIGGVPNPAFDPDLPSPPAEPISSFSDLLSTPSPEVTSDLAPLYRQRQSHGLESLSNKQSSPHVNRNDYIMQSRSSRHNQNAVGETSDPYYNVVARPVV